jgi:hypothetical protein
MYDTSNDSGENWQSEFELLDIGVADVEARPKVGREVGLARETTVNQVADEGKYRKIEDGVDADGDAEEAAEG